MLVDTHCHLGHLEQDVDEALSQAAASGVGLVIDIGMGTSESAATVERADRSDGRVLAAVGLHPNDLVEYEADADAAIGRLRELAKSPSVVAVGETGLDHYRERSERDLQRSAFEAQIALAKETDRTLVIHCRDAHDALSRVLETAGPPERIVMHCFSGDAGFARRCADRGWFCSFAGNLTYPKSGDLREIASAVPPELVLVETDAPYLAPQPMRGKPNAPALVRHTFDTLVSVRATDAEDLEAQLLANTRRAFALNA